MYYTFSFKISQLEVSLKEKDSLLSYIKETGEVHKLIFFVK